MQTAKPHNLKPMTHAVCVGLGVSLLLRPVGTFDWFYALTGCFCATLLLAGLMAGDREYLLLGWALIAIAIIATWLKHGGF